MYSVFTRKDKWVRNISRDEHFRKESQMKMDSIHKGDKREEKVVR